MEQILEVKNLSKTIGRRKIIDDLSFSCRAGEIYGFLGPNGAGKTSTFKMILGLWSIDRGSVEICGCDVDHDFEQAMALTGGVVEIPAFYDSLSGRENLRMYARIRRGIDEGWLSGIIERTGLSGCIDEKVRRYSLGMKQRLGLARAILHRPRLLLLDEPTNGLDPAGNREMRDLIVGLAHEQGLCVVLSSHLINEMEHICDRVGILTKGRLIEEKNVTALTGGERGGLRTAYRFEVTPIRKARELLAHFSGGTVLAVTSQWLDVLLTKEELAALNQLFVENGVSLQTVAPVAHRSLEEAFLEITGGDRID